MSVNSARLPVPLVKSYLLLNHGPVTLVSSAAVGVRNVMAAAWVMPLDFDPPKVAIVVDRSTYTRELIEASGEFVLNIPPRALAGKVLALGASSGRDEDKFVRHQLAVEPATRVTAPLLTDCLAWLECRVIAERAESIIGPKGEKLDGDGKKLINSRVEANDEIVNEYEDVPGMTLRAYAEAKGKSNA